ncbi:MAG: lipopolysaccharide transport protein LptA [Candidatus Deianiraeaceae bacterium]|jgi:lipopolysaccharide transport protein LptA
MHKKTILKLLLFLLTVSLIFPIYYISDLVITSIIIKKLQKSLHSPRHQIEYFTFNNLESVIKRKFNNVEYSIYAFADKTKGSADLVRDKNKNLIIQSTDISNIHGTIQNQQTKDLYHFKSAYLNILHSTQVTLYKDFYLALAINSTPELIEMRGDSLTFNLDKETITSNKSVIFSTENALLSGGNFLFRNGKITMSGDIFLDTDKAIISAHKLEVYTQGTKPMVSKDNQVLFQKAVFSKDVKFFDKENNVHASAKKIIIDNAKQVIYLKGNAEIIRSDSVIKGDTMQYDLSKGFAKVQGKINKDTTAERVQLKIQY